MKRIRPDFYNEFHCIADSCTITCCQEWKIAVDPDTNRKWKKVSAPLNHLSVMPPVVNVWIIYVSGRAK